MAFKKTEEKGNGIKNCKVKEEEKEKNKNNNNEKIHYD